MRSWHIVSLVLGVIIISIDLPAQSYHYMFSHDTVGNRTARVYQGTTPAKEGQVEQTNDIETDNESYQDVDLAFFPLIWSASQSISSSAKDTTKYGPLVKTPAEKESFQQAMMDEVFGLQPLPSGYDDRSLTDYSVGAIPLEYGVSGTGARTYSVPILTAPDIKYAPSLSLVYNSQGGYITTETYGYANGYNTSITAFLFQLYHDI